MANTDWFRIDVRGTSCTAHAPARPRRRHGGGRDRQRPADHRFARDQPLRAGRHYRRRAARRHRAQRYRRYRLPRRHGAHLWRFDARGNARAHAPHRRAHCGGLGAEAELTDYTIANYKVENDVASSERCRQAVVKCLGAAGEGHYRGTLSGEDFSEYLRRVPGVLAFVGTRNPKIGATYAQHSCFYKIDETVLAKAPWWPLSMLSTFWPSHARGARRPHYRRSRRNQSRSGSQVTLCQATAAEARDAMHDARTARHAAIKGIHEARAAARHEEKHNE